MRKWLLVIPIFILTIVLSVNSAYAYDTNNIIVKEIKNAYVENAGELTVDTFELNDFITNVIDDNTLIIINKEVELYVRGNDYGVIYIYSIYYADVGDGLLVLFSYDDTYIINDYYNYYDIDIRATQTAFDDVNEAYNSGYYKGKKEGENIGYIKGLGETDAYGFKAMLFSVFAGLGSFLGLQLLPGITFGAIIAVPVIFGLIAWILGRKKD